MTFQLSHLAPQFLQGMVTAMYAYEARMPLDPNLLNDAEMRDFYMAYMGAPPPTQRKEPVTTDRLNNPEHLLQDCDPGLSKALANAPHAHLDAKEAAMAILEARLRKLGYVPEELEKDNPYNQWMAQP